MFSKGQWLFGILFAVVFIALVIFAYRKDTKLHQHYYKGAKWVLILFIAFLASISLYKFLFG